MTELVLPFHPEAEAELFDALDYYDELDRLQDTRLAADLARLIEEALDDIEAAPERYPAYLFGRGVTSCDASPTRWCSTSRPRW